VLGRDGHRRDAGRRHRGTTEPGLEGAVDGDGHQLAVLVDAPEAARRQVQRGGPRVVTGGSSEGLAGEPLHGLEVVSLERAHEIAAQASAAPGPKGEPLGTRIEVRQVMGAPSTE
jgi:hypothetical protein